MKKLYAYNSLKCKINIFFFLFGNPNLRGGGEGGVDPVGTKSQLNPKILSEGSPKQRVFGDEQEFSL